MKAYQQTNLAEKSMSSWSVQDQSSSRSLEHTASTSRKRAFNPGWEGPLVPVFQLGLTKPGLKVPPRGRARALGLEDL